MNAPIQQVGFSVPKVQGKVGSVTIHLEKKKLLIDFGMVHRAETGHNSGSVHVGQEIGRRFLHARRTSGAQPI